MDLLVQTPSGKVISTALRTAANASAATDWALVDAASGVGGGDWAGVYWPAPANKLRQALQAPPLGTYSIW